MKSLTQHIEEINERIASPILNDSQLNRVWNNMTNEMNAEELLDAIYSCMDSRTKNEVFWKIDQKYHMHAFPK